MKGTMLDLFKAAGYDDYKNFPIDEPVTPKNRIGIYTWENGKKLKEVTALFYKGEADGGYKITSSRGSFLATNSHMLYEPKAHKFTKVEDAYGKDFEGLLDDGTIEKIKIEKVNDKFSILDCSVEDTHCYFSAGLLSHNSFGSRAKALTEFCNKYNILCANYGTTVLWISQERANLNPMARLPTACVTPDTMIEIFEFEEDHISRITMETLFKKVGLENYSTLKVDTFYDISDKKLYTNSYNEKTQKVEKELIEALVYKGKAPIYELVNSNGEIFLKCSGKHRLYDPNTKDYVEVENIESIDALLSTGDIINLKVRKTDAEMPIVDLKVRNNHNYFPNSILSHNTGGEAINYYTSITCRITKTDDIKDATGDVCGIEMRVRNYKNKCSVPFRDANMKLYYDGGFDSNSEYIDFLLLLGMVKQAGAYFKFNHDGQDYSLQGRKKLQEWLDTHADVYDSWKKEIIEKISHHNEILDANNQATDENGNEISLDEAKKMGNAVDVADLASQALAAAAVTD